MVVGYLFICETDTRRIADIRTKMSECAASRGDNIDSWTIEREYSVDKEKNITDTMFLGMESGDTLYIENMAFIVRTLSDMLSIIGGAIERGITVKDISGNYIPMSISDKSTYLRTLNQVDELYAKLVSARTRAALDRRRKDGAKLGRPAGSCSKMTMLLNNDRAIKQDIQDGVSIDDICQKYGVSGSTFRRYREVAMPSAQQVGAQTITNY